MKALEGYNHCSRLRSNMSLFTMGNKALQLHYNALQNGRSDLDCVWPGPRFRSIFICRIPSVISVSPSDDDKAFSKIQNSSSRSVHNSSLQRARRYALLIPVIYKAATDNIIPFIHPSTTQRTILNTTFINGSSLQKARTYRNARNTRCAVLKIDGTPPTAQTPGSNWLIFLLETPHGDTFRGTEAIF